jgi:type IX secretion system substrate protein
MTAIKTFTTTANRMAEEENVSFPFNIYPNPADAAVTIAFSTIEEGSFTIKLVDMLGRVVKSEINNARLGDNTYIINLDGVGKGVYLVVLQHGDNISKAKLVVE